MHGNSKALGEGMSGDAGYINLDRTSASATTIAAWSAIVSTDGPWIAEEPWPRGLDACEIRLRNEVRHTF